MGERVAGAKAISIVLEMWEGMEMW